MAETALNEHSEEPRIAPSTTSVEDDVRLKYFEARRDEQTHEAMRAARVVAEAICDGLAPEIPDESRAAYVKGLNARIEVLEHLAAQGRTVPRAIVAGLRTLQAYGNYASHYNKGDGKQPPASATKSAMASLALVVQWFLGRADEETPGIALRDPPPATPRLLERWRIQRRLKLSTPEFKYEGDVSPHAVLAAVYAFYAQSVSICERICREVITRETTLDGNACESDQLALLVEQIAEANPTRVPRSVAADIAELWRRRAVLVRAIRDRDDDVEHFLVELKRRNLAKDVRDWFDGDYLSRTKMERFWLKYVVLIVASWVLIGECKSGWKDEARQDIRSQLASTYCVEPAAKGTPICVDLLREAKSSK